MVLDLGLIDYEEAYKVQKEFVRRRKLGEVGDSIILAEHNAVFTIGRTGRRENLLVDEAVLKRSGIKVLSVDRGGDITFHGPGQIVIYPIIDLKDRSRDLHRYLRDLEELVMNFLEAHAISAGRLIGKTGVWAGTRKIAFIGIGASDWVTYHGLSVNVNIDLRFFSMMHLCGMKDVEATSISAIRNECVPMDEAKRRILYEAHNIFDLIETDSAEERNAILA